MWAWSIAANRCVCSRSRRSGWPLEQARRSARRRAPDRTAFGLRWRGGWWRAARSDRAAAAGPGASGASRRARARASRPARASAPASRRPRDRPRGARARSAGAGPRRRGAATPSGRAARTSGRSSSCAIARDARDPVVDQPGVQRARRVIAPVPTSALLMSSASGFQRKSAVSSATRGNGLRPAVTSGGDHRKDRDARQQAAARGDHPADGQAVERVSRRGHRADRSRGCRGR